MRRLGRLPIGDQFRPWVTAEIGQNHNGDAYTAIRLVSDAVAAGADAVKFQLRDCELEYDEETLSAPHPNPSNAFGNTYREHRKKLDLTLSQLGHIQRRIQYNRWPVSMYVTPCHVKLVDELERQLDPPLYKVASKDTHNLELIERVARIGKPVILSTGMSAFSELESALDVVRKYTPEVAVMHCRSLYPCPLSSTDLRAIGALSERLDCLVGFSDHSGCKNLAGGAVALGASLLEVHLTFAKDAKGTDHRASLTKHELAEYVDSSRQTYEALGNDSLRLPPEIKRTDKYQRQNKRQVV